MKCIRCGAENETDALFCGQCGTMIQDEADEKNETKKQEPHGSANRMPQGIALGVNEQLVRRYRIGRYAFFKGFIDVLVTNKRVIRYERSMLFGMQNNQIDEINLDAVNGVSVSMRRSISIIGIIAAIILMIWGFNSLNNRSLGWAVFLMLIMLGGFWTAGLYSMKLKENMDRFKTKMTIIVICSGIGIAALVYFIKDAAWNALWMPALIWGAFGIVIYYSLKPSLIFSVQGTLGGPSLKTYVNLRGRILRSSNAGAVFQFKPTAQTTDMLKEIGACIYDLKTLGDEAIGIWADPNAMTDDITDMDEQDASNSDEHKEEGNE